jgi:hypothetical protein
MLARPVDKTNFKKKTPFLTYAEASANHGVFDAPW